MKQMKGKLRLSANDKKIAGVCGGIAEYFGLESTLLRIIFVLLVILFRGLPIALYLICWAVIPKSV